ncbi:DUF389 domain-containing protein [Urechidicola sp. KH5]
MQDNSTSNNQEQKQGQEEKTSNDFSTIWNDFKVILVSILEIKSDTDKKGTIQDIKDGISMKGHTAWVLIFSILIASIGLNVSSPAVVIGAMLISPLMGPILGVGLSIAINDIDTLRRSFVNLGVMIGLSLITSFIFFKIPLFQELTPEIKARTAPDVRDVFVAVAGGLALIMAISRRSKQTNTIAGVAIATALMPPLCTAGYGLAVWDMQFFFGAMFLFTINTIFIALATFLIVKFLRFPMVKYINSAKRKRVAQIAGFVALLIMSFSIYEFVQLYKKDRYIHQVENLIEDMKTAGIHIFDTESENINYDAKTVKLILYGNLLSEGKIKEWKERLPDYRLTGTILNIEQSVSTDLEKKVEELTDLYSRNQSIIASRDEKIAESEDEISELKQELRKHTKVPFKQLSEEAKINYSGLKTLSYANFITTDFSRVDTISVFNVTWYDSIPNQTVQERQLKLWLKTRLELDTIQLYGQ